MITKDVKIYSSSEFDQIKEDEFNFWQSKTPIERLAAVELLRQNSINHMIHKHKTGQSIERLNKGIQRTIKVISTIDGTEKELVLQ